ncbi:phage holin family protein [Enterobacter cancerogenus]
MREFCQIHLFFMHYRHELGYSVIACIVAVTRHWQNGDSFRNIATNGIYVTVAAFGMNEILTLFDIDGSQWSYLASAWLGYVGVQGLLKDIRRKLASSVEKNQNDVTSHKK